MTLWAQEKRGVVVGCTVEPSLCCRPKKHQLLRGSLEDLPRNSF